MTSIRTRPFGFVPPRQGNQQRPGPSGYVGRLRSRVAVAGPISPVRIGVSWTLAALALLALWFVFFATVLSSLQQAHAQHNAYALFREELTQLSPRIAPLGGTITPDSPVALLSAPSLGLKDVVIIEGTASGDLARGPGHKRDTPLPGQAGVSVVLGRATLFGGPFGRLSHGSVGAIITVTTGQGAATYRIEDVRRVGDPFPISLNDGEGQLTLISSEGGNLANGWVPRRPLYLDAKLQGKPFASPPGRPAGVPKSESALKGDPGALFMLVLWLPLLVLISIGLVWLQDRWGRWQTWLVGAPVLLAGLWGLSETAVQLLPNLM